MKSTQQRWAGKKKIKVTWALGEQVPPLSAIREEQLKFTPLCSFPTVITATLEGTLIDNLTAIPISSSTNLACVDVVHWQRTPYGPPGVLAITRTLEAEIGSGRRFSFCKEHRPSSDPVQIERPFNLFGYTHVASSSPSWLTRPSRHRLLFLECDRTWIRACRTGIFSFGALQVNVFVILVHKAP